MRIVYVCVQRTSTIPHFINIKKLKTLSWKIFTRGDPQGKFSISSSLRMLEMTYILVLISRYWYCTNRKKMSFGKKFGGCSGRCFIKNALRRRCKIDQLRRGWRTHLESCFQNKKISHLMEYIFSKSTDAALLRMCFPQKNMFLFGKTAKAMSLNFAQFGFLVVVREILFPRKFDFF